MREKKQPDVKNVLFKLPLRAQATNFDIARLCTAVSVYTFYVYTIDGDQGTKPRKPARLT